MPNASGVMSPTDFMTPTDMVTHFEKLESLGYESGWITDMFVREIYVTAAHLLANTDTIKVTSGIAHIYGRDAIASAQAGRTLNDLYDNRFVQGLGVSHPIAAEMRGVPWVDPVALVRDYFTAMRDASVLGVQGALPPLYLAAHGPRMVAVAAEVADGVNTYMQPPSHTAATRETLGPDKAINIVFPCCLSTDADAARAVARQALSIYLPLPAYQRQWAKNGFGPDDWTGGGSDRLVDTFVAWGDLDHIKGRMAEHLDAGASDIIVAGYNATPGAGHDWDLLEALAPTAE